MKNGLLNESHRFTKSSNHERKRHPKEWPCKNEKQNNHYHGDKKEYPVFGNRLRIIHYNNFLANINALSYLKKFIPKKMNFQFINQSKK